MINAIVLAAGESKRMGKPKPLLQFEGTTFLGHILSVLGASDVGMTTVVLGSRANAIRESVDLAGVQVVVNENYRKGQLSSLIAALNALPAQAEAVLLCLVDHPFITSELVNQIVDKFLETGAPIVAPVYDGRRGHPTLFARPLFSELLAAPEHEGARYVVYSDESRVLDIDVSEPKCLLGVDTPEDYARHFGRSP